jgi:superfamily II DNA or RNA helicase
VAPDILLQKVNEVFLHVKADSSIYAELSEYFSFFVPGHKFMPSYRNKMWDGKIRLFNSRNATIYCGLKKYIDVFAKERGYTVGTKDSLTLDCKGQELDNFISSNVLTSRNNIIELHDYQAAAIKHAIENEKTLLLSPTASGKSLIIYCLARWYIEKFDDNVLIVVPTTSLVEQMYTDFADYSTKNSFNVEQSCHRIYSGKEKINLHHRIIITTWQSIFRLPPSWFSRYGLVIGDEAHTFKAKSLTKIMESLTNARYRIGTTGTLDGTQTNQLVLEGVFGPVYTVTTTRDLIDRDVLSDIMIQVVSLKYTDEERKAAKKLEYHEEIDFIVSHPRRAKFVYNLAAAQKGNTLILFKLVEKHGKTIHENIVKRVANEENRKVFLIHGGVDTEDREAIRSIVEKETNAIIVASLGTFSTGINIRNLHNLIFASPSKSQIKVLQSIGRGLRKSDNGQITKVYDIVDDLSWKSKRNYTLSHAEDRINIYSKQKLPFKVAAIDI